MPDQNPSSDQDRDSQPSVKPNSSSRIENDNEPDPSTTTATQEQQRSDKFFRRASLTIDCLVFVAVAVYSVFAALQWYAMRDQLSEMKQTKSIGRLDERAWISISEIRGQPEVGKPWKVTVVAKNTGKTPAKRFLLMGKVMGKELADPDPDFDGEVRNIRQEKVLPSLSNGGILAPNAETPLIFETTFGDQSIITQQELNYLKSPTIVVLVFGKVTYRDIFDCDHWQTFCGKWRKDGTGFEGYGAYNDPDENCIQ